MLENVSALPLKLLNINNLDYVQLRDMIKRESKKRKSTKRKTKRKIGNLDTETIAIKEYLNSLSEVVPKYNQVDEKIRDNHFPKCKKQTHF